MSPPQSSAPQARAGITRAFTAATDVLYIGLGVSLACGALAVLVIGVIDFGEGVLSGKASAILFLERLLLVLLILELLYTVQVSFREHALAPEPFLIVGLISAIRRVLVLTAEFGEMHGQATMSEYFIIELAVHTVLILALAISLVLLRKRGAPVVAEHAG
jgi:uncharacterized membrane protein (DUF373 family)